jgi:Asp-tRNA(Asn)/Glu-tRNA(Gln) amidotransferase A subunit family amidase
VDREPLTITAAAPLLQSGQLTPSDLLEQCLARTDRYEEKVRAWVYLDRERARTEAAQLTAEITQGLYRGPLHGIPIGIKDIIDVFDMPTGCGSRLWANSYARRDATCVQRLRQAGALILGKTVTTTYAFLDPPPTRNPWNLERTPGGSSSGSAAAVACGMCLAALGTQTGGSITRPASYCGVCSLKPTYGRVSVGGVLPLAPSLDHVGVMANCVRDLAVVYEAIAGTDGESGRALAIPAAIWLIDQRLSADIKQPPPRFARLRGVFDELAEPVMRSAIDRLVLDLRSLSSTQALVTDVVPPAGFSSLPRHHRTMMAVEAATYHVERLAAHPDDYPPRIRELIEEGQTTSATRYREASLERDGLEIQMDDPAVWSGHYVTPATTGPAPDASTTGNPVFNSPWSFTGLPTVSFPIARGADGLPLAVQLVGKSEHDGWLLAAAAWVEQVVGFERRLPPVP